MKRVSYNAANTEQAVTVSVMTPQEIQQAIAANTNAIGDLNQALNFLVTEFIRPNAQQHLQSLERLDRIEGIAEAITEQQQVNTQQIAQNVEAIARFDERLEETRTLVAANGSQIAQLGIKVDANAVQITRLKEAVEASRDETESLKETVEASREETEALKEITRTQLAGIIGNAQRINRLEQQAS